MTHESFNKVSHKQGFLEHINSIDPTIMFTVDSFQGNGGNPFLDTLVTPEVDNVLSIKVYHKPIHTDQYLQWDSHHNLSAKYSVIGTLTHRAKTVCTKSELLQKELYHLREALVKCKYSPWAMKRVQNKLINNNQGDNNDNIQDGTSNTGSTTTQNNNARHTTLDQGMVPEVTPANRDLAEHNSNTDSTANTTTTTTKTMIGQVVVPYTKGLSESFKNICGKYGIQAYFKGNITIKQTLMKPKDQDPKDNKSGLIYSYKCQDITCGEEYIGHSKDPWGTGTKTILKDHHLFMCTSSTQGIMPQLTTSL